MKLSDLLEAILSHDALAARQWVADAERGSFDWSAVDFPARGDATYRALAAAVVELFAERVGVVPPDWTAIVGAAPEPVYLVKAASTMRRLRELCESEAPEPLRRRLIYAPPDFLRVA